nr:EamA family transporter [Lentilactobacillus senioris]
MCNWWWFCVLLFSNAARRRSMASLVFFIKPALAPILAMILIHERLTTNMVIGIIVIILGSVVSFIDNQRQQVVS